MLDFFSFGIYNTQGKLIYLTRWIMSFTNFDDVLQVSLLYDFYGELLTERQKEIMELYQKKNLAYGNSFHKARKDVPCYTLGKLYDKFNRYMNLTLHPENAAFETVEDTLLDMANYCIMELAEMRCEKGETE